jgi:hypothetical protein
MPNFKPEDVPAGNACIPGPRRRIFLQRSSVGLAAAVAAGSSWAEAPASATENPVKLPLIQDPKTEQAEETPDPNSPPDDRVGYAIVGLGLHAARRIAS